MSVNLKKPLKKDILHVKGFDFFTFNAEVKDGVSSNDFLIIKLHPKSSTSAIFTLNKFCAAPVTVAKKNIKKTNPNMMVINSGNANAGNGAKGIEVVEKINTSLAEIFSIDSESILPFSTGIILVPMPLKRILTNIHKFCCKKINYGKNWIDAAKSIMTTDTCPKVISKKFSLDSSLITCTGIAKGSGMINPNMATMLSFIFTDVKITKKMLFILNKEIAERTFNLITVDGDTSTNDSFVISSSNLASNKKINCKNNLYYLLKKELLILAANLSQMIIRDGEGVTKFVEIEIKNAKNLADVNHLGKAVANSPLVKTAFFASDPNLGRILSAIGNTNISDLDVSTIDIKLNKLTVVKNGQLSKSYNEKLASKSMKSKEFKFTIDLKQGKETASVFTNDLSYEYIKINAEYRT